MTSQRIALAAGGVLLAAGLAAVPVLAGHGRSGMHGGHPGHGHSWEGFVERHDANDDGTVSREELGEAAEKHFGKLDRDGDGTISEQDFTALRSAHLVTFLAHHADGDDDGDLTAAELDAWFAARDKTGDGRLDAADFEGEDGEERGHRHHRIGKALDADQDGAVEPLELRELVAGFDADRDGTLAAAELPEVEMGHGPRGRHGHHGEMLEKIDANGDGTITRAEWDAAVAAHHPKGDTERANEHFEKLDANDDGVLSGDELPARRHRRERGH